MREVIDAVAAVTLAAAAFAQVPATVVVVAGDRPVVAARVTITCPTRRAEARTDVDGRAPIPAWIASGCTIDIAATGFAPVHREWPGADAIGALTVSLDVAPQTEQVDVVGSAASGDGPRGWPVTRLSIAGRDPARWVELAQLTAGAPLGAADIRVNGVSGDLPADGVTAIAVAPDPFSARFGDATRLPIDVTSMLPPRWHISLLPGSVRAGGGDPLTGAAGDATTAWRVAGGGPLDRRARWRVAATAYTSRITSTPTFLSPLSNQVTVAPATTRRSTGGSAAIEYRTDTTSVQWGGSAARDEMPQAGIGGTATPLDAIALDTRRAQGYVTADVMTTAYRMRAGLRAARQSTSATSDATGRGIVFADRWLAGAPDVLSATTRATDVDARIVVEPVAAGIGWRTGADVTSGTLTRHETANPLGQLIVSSRDAASGVVALDHDVTARGTARVLAVFGERVLAGNERLWLRAGLRAEAHAGDTLQVLPRAIGAISAGGVIVGLSAGTFATPWSATDDAERDRRITVDRVYQVGSATIPLRFAGAAAVRRDVVVRSLVIRPLAWGALSLEHTWTRGTHLSGLTRTADGGALVDRLNDRRTLSRHQVHARADILSRGWMATAHYEFAWSEDDTAGTFALPASSGDLAAERGPSAGVPHHAVTLVAAGPLRWRWQGLVTLRATSGLPVTRVTGLDPEGLYTFTGRDVRARNAGRLDDTVELNLYLQRTVLLPWRLSADLGVEVANALNRVRPLVTDLVAGLPTTGQTLVASPGRRLSFWVAVGRQ